MQATRPIDLKYEGSAPSVTKKRSDQTNLLWETTHNPALQGPGIDLEVFMTEKELYEQEKRRILTPENLEFIRAVYQAIWGGANNDTATIHKR